VAAGGRHHGARIAGSGRGEYFSGSRASSRMLSSSARSSASAKRHAQSGPSRFLIPQAEILQPFGSVASQLG